MVVATGGEMEMKMLGKLLHAPLYVPQGREGQRGKSSQPGRPSRFFLDQHPNYQVVTHFDLATQWFKLVRHKMFASDFNIFFISCRFLDF